MIKKEAKYLREYKDLSLLDKVKYNLNRDIFTLAPAKKSVKGVELTFLGATRTVTGSKYLIETGKTKVLIDCGLFQGLKELRLRNWANLPVHPKNVDAIILTHAHLDHSGYIPLMVNHGFRGKVYCTSATYDLCKILLPDSGFLQEEDARYAKKKKYSKHANPKPLYTQKDAVASLKYFKIVDFNQEIKLTENMSFKFIHAGHIIGAASIIAKVNNEKFLFSGDLGRNNSPIVRNPQTPEAVDYVITESTYGDRLHEDTNPMDKIEEVINKTISKGGKIIIPAFSVGRTQKILYYINQLKNEGRIPNITVFLDSPMSIKVTSLVDDYEEENKLTREQYQDIYNDVKFCVTRQQSKQIFNFPDPCIIVSASGMATGGRVLHHIANYGTRPNCTILFTGFQAEGTRGRDLLDGRKQVKIHGEIINIKAKVELIPNMSDHADYREIIDWLKAMPEKPKKVFVTHGEVEASKSLAERIKNELGWETEVPEYLETEGLN